VDREFIGSHGGSARPDDRDLWQALLVVDRVDASVGVHGGRRGKSGQRFRAFVAEHLELALGRQTSPLVRTGERVLVFAGGKRECDRGFPFALLLPRAQTGTARTQTLKS